MTRMRAKGCICNVPACGAPVQAKGLCFKHYLRKRRHGDTSVNKTPTKGSGVYWHKSGYKMLSQPDGSYKMEHVIMAETALGKRLPPGAVVHHVDRDGFNNNTKSRWNLVVCPDHAYHMLLHRRARKCGYEPPWKGAKLTDQQADEIRASRERRDVLAARYGISISSIKKIRAGKLRPSI